MVSTVNARYRTFGFTLIELLVTLAVIALLLSIVTPRFTNGITKAEEAVLRENLRAVREALDKHNADSGKYPDSLNELVTKKYLRNVPKDPITDSSESWILVAPADPKQGLVFDIRSGAQGTGLDGKNYETW